MHLELKLLLRRVVRLEIWIGQCFGYCCN